MSPRMDAMSAILLGGKPIELCQSARTLKLNPGYLSRVLSGTQDPETVRWGILKRLARFFQFDTTDGLVEAIQQRRRELDRPPASADGGVADELTSRRSSPTSFFSSY